jgi:hypothetical protein
MFYPKIETLFERDPVTFKVIPEKFRNDAYKLINEWEWTEKIDGTNIWVSFGEVSRPINDIYHKVIYKAQDSTQYDVKYGGRTENAQIPKGIIEYLNDHIDSEKLYEMFGNKPVVFYGEGYGPKIQCGDGYAETQKFIVFDILVGGNSGYSGYWLKRSDIEDICSKLGLDVVPLIDMIKYFGNTKLTSIELGINLVKRGFKSTLGDGSMDAEGLIGRTSIPLFDSKHRRLICKLKTCDFLKEVDTFFEFKKL